MLFLLLRSLETFGQALSFTTLGQGEIPPPL